MDSTSPIVVVGTVAITLVTGWALTFSYRVWSLRRKRVRKKAVCQQALQHLREKLKNGKVSAERRAEIASWSFTELVNKLQSGEVQAVDALETYQFLALEAHEKTNCLTEPLVEAESEALACDASSEKKGPLHGVPISIKDNYGIKGYDSTGGCSVYLDQPYTEDCVLVKVLKKQGAIPYVKTNVPATMISWETTNPIFGMTCNPHNPERGVGGSSGGEGALLAAGGSVVGMGSDIGGSLRIPAALCGVCSFKPTQGRLSTKGMFAFKSHQNLVEAAAGPLACDVDTLVAVMKALLVPAMFELDNTIAPLPFNERPYQSRGPLRIGYYTQDDFFRAVPACERAVHVAKDALQDKGHQLVAITLPESVWTMAMYWGQSVIGDRGETLYELLQYESIDSSIGNLYPLLLLNLTVRKILSFIMRPIMPRLALQIKALCGCSSVSEWWDLCSKVRSLREKVMQDWKDKGLDAVICPGFSCPALRLDSTAQCSGAASYTMVYNLLDFPAGSVPVTTVNSQDVVDMKSYPLRDLWDWTIRKDMKGSEGLPVGVQVVTLPWQEEQCLRVMKELETALKL